ncbi:MAG: hypothetical protein ACE5LU_21785 [Anaerolineae bacterium]
MSISRSVWMLLLGLAWLLLPAPSLDLSPVQVTGPVAGSHEPHATPWWVDFLGQESTLDGQLLPAGAVVRAYDPTGVLAGQAEVTLSGWYLISVYRDDPSTELDEGATPGDRIAFTVNGYQAVPLGPDAPLWVQSGNLVRVELRACTLAGDFDCDCRVTVGDLMRQAAVFGVSQGQAGYYPPFDPDGDYDIDSGDLQQVAGLWRTACRG